MGPKVSVSVRVFWLVMALPGGSLGGYRGRIKPLLGGVQVASPP
jgi:hypothetical protein